MDILVKYIIGNILIILLCILIISLANDKTVDIIFGILMTLNIILLGINAKKYYNVSNTENPNEIRSKAIDDLINYVNTQNILIENDHILYDHILNIFKTFKPTDSLTNYNGIDNKWFNEFKYILNKQIKNRVDKTYIIDSIINYIKDLDTKQVYIKNNTGYY